MTKRTMPKRKETWKKWKYCKSTHEPRRCPAYGKSCVRCQRVNHFKLVCKNLGRQVSNDGRRERCRGNPNKSQDNKQTEVAPQEFDIVTAKVFNIHNVRSVIIVKLKTNKKPCGLWHSWKNMFRQFSEGMMTLFYGLYGAVLYFNYFHNVIML